MNRHALFVGLSLGLIGLSGTASAQTVDLGNLDDRGFIIRGAAADDAAGTSVSGAGDVNGDGLADLIVGADRADGNGDNAGAGYVVFGRTDTAPVDLDDLGAGGFAILGAGAGDRAGQSVSGAGDVNGDGLADLIVGSPAASIAYVVFGKADATPVDLGDLGTGGFAMDGGSGRLAGASVAGAGDIDGDGLADVIVGATRANGVSSQTGAAYVVFGKADSAPLSLVDLGERGFRIAGAGGNTQMGNSVSGVGDINGDGLADVLVGVSGSDNGGLDVGEAFVVFGKRDADDVDVRNAGTGFGIRGDDAEDRAGGSVAGIGDMNGDGLADLIVGAANADPNGNNSGASYVVFGKADGDTVQLGSLGARGFVVRGAASGHHAGISVAGAGDLNGDGRADIIVGADRARPNGTASGTGFVVFGKSTSSAVNLGSLGSNGFAIRGAAANHFTGRSVSAAGDVNGDGVADVIVGATGAGATGAAYVVFTDLASPASSRYLATSFNDAAAITRFGDTGDGSMDDSPDGRAWLDFDDGGDPGGSASIEELTLVRSAEGFDGALADVSWQLESSRTDFDAALLSLRYLDGELDPSVKESALQLYFSPTGTAPFEALPSVVDTARNRLSTRIDAGQAGFFFIGESVVTDRIFGHGFELP